MFIASLFTPWAFPIGLALTSIFVTAWFWPTTKKKEGEAPESS
jgi:hypothetical protein